MLQPEDDRPRWLREVVAAKKAAFDALSIEDQEEARRAQAAARESAAARRRDRATRTVARAKQIVSLFHDGQTAAEIGRAVGLNERNVRKIAASHGFSIPHLGVSVARLTKLSLDREHSLRRLAVDHGTTAAEALEDLLVFALDDDASIARRTLHVRRKKGAPI